MAITISKGIRVRFQSLSLTDPNVYVGVITDLLSYKTASKFLDVEGSTETINQSSSTSSNLDFKNLEYFILAKESTLNQQTTDIVFAKEWINESTFTILDQLYTGTVSVIGVTSEQLQSAIELLQADGYVVQLLKQTVA